MNEVFEKVAFEELDIEIVEFTTADIITTSPLSGDDETEGSPV